MNNLLHRKVVGLRHVYHYSSPGYYSSSIKCGRNHKSLNKTTKIHTASSKYICALNYELYPPEYKINKHNYSNFILHPNISTFTSLFGSLNGALNHSNNRFSELSLQQHRYIHSSLTYFEQASSKIEVTVQKLKDKQKEEEQKKENQISQAQSSSSSSTVESSTSDSNVQTSTTIESSAKSIPVKVKKPLTTRIWEEIVHYYHGFRLLFIDINICRKLLWRVLMGKKLTRRENRLLIRTTSDLFRLLPFSIFIIVPFMEFLLPVFIKFFPGMLPSTFQTSKDREDKLKQSLQVRLEVAKFLQKTLDEMAVQHVDHKSEEAKEFSSFFKKIKNPNEYVPQDEIIKFAKQFEDEITLDSLSRGQLTGLCRILELNTVGTNNFLRFQLRMKLRSLAADDRVIQREGVDSLNMIELQQACKARGMRAYGLSEEKLRRQLQEWIDLSVNEKVPSTLLLLSRAIMTPDEIPTTDKLKATISSLPDAVGTQTKAAIGEREGKIDNKTKIEIIKEEERKIQEELEEEKEVEQEKAKEEIRKQAEILVDKAPILTDEPKPNVETKVVQEPDVISSKDVEVIEEALETLSKDKNKLLVEKEAIKDLKEEIEEYKEDVEELKEITKGDTKRELRETRAAKILFKKVDSMINNLDKVLTDLEKKEKKLREDIQAIPESEIEKEKKDQLVRVDELVGAIKQLRTVSDESKLITIEKVLSKIDDDHDGQIKVDDVMKVIETIGKEDVKLSEKQFGELVELLDKEEILEAEDKIEKALAKAATKQEEELKDKADVIEDKSKELDPISKQQQNDSKNAQSKESTTTTTKLTEQQALEALKSAVEKQKEKILPSPESIPSPPPPTIPPSTSKQTNPKDKMI